MIYTIIATIFQILNIIIFIRVILSWIPHNQFNPFIETIYRISNPILEPIQRNIPPLGGRIDISPIIAIFLLQFIQGIILSFLGSF